MFIEFSLICFLLAISSVFWHYTFWIRRKVEGPIPLPLFGNLFQYFIGRKHFGQIYNDLYRKYPDASYVGFYAFGTQAIVVRDLELTQKVLVDDFVYFHGNDWIGLDEKYDPLLSKNPVLSSGKQWRVNRNQILPIYGSTKKVKSMIPLIQEISNQWRDYIRSDIGKSNESVYELQNLALKYTFELVAKCGLGIEAHAFDREDAPFGKNLMKVFQLNFISSTKFLLLTFFGDFYKLLGMPFLNSNANMWIRNLINSITEKRNKNSDKGKDFLQSILDNRVKWNSNEEITIAHAFTFFVAGFETTGIIMALCVFEIASNLTIQKRIQQEIDDTMRLHNGDLTAEAIQSLNYLEATFHETLRVYSPSFSINRLCTKDYKLPPQYPGRNQVIIPAGTRVIIPKWGIHTDAKYYPNPEVFDPERFSDIEVHKRPKFAYIGFSEGPRNCVGRKFVLMQVKIALATLLHNFDMTVLPKTFLAKNKLRIPRSFDCKGSNNVLVRFRRRP